jgi:hypothetical protein
VLNRKVIAILQATSHIHNRCHTFEKSYKSNSLLTKKARSLILTFKKQVEIIVSSKQIN